MNIDGNTKVGGLIGNPVRHTLSPLIHHMLSELCGINFVYVPFEVKELELPDAIRGAYALGLSGLNVTVPYKSRVIPFLKSVDDLAEKIGAVNTLVRIEDGFKGYNTDMPGLYRAMRSDGIELSGKKVMILGAGGAARSVAYLCASKGASEIYLFNRTYEKAAAIAQELNRVSGEKKVVPLEMTQYTQLQGRDYVAIQATSVGLAPHSDEVVISDPDFYKKVAWGYDLIYKPSETRFMKMVKQYGGSSFNGLKMLLYQGIISYELWNHVEITEQQATLVFEHLKEACYVR